MEGILEASGAVQGGILEMMVLAHDRLPGLSSEVTFELPETQPDDHGQQVPDGA